MNDVPFAFTDAVFIWSGMNEVVMNTQCVIFVKIYDEPLEV